MRGVGSGHGFELREDQVVDLVRVRFDQGLEALDLCEEVLELGQTLSEEGIFVVVGGEEAS